jgi:hypothetical protein
MPLDCCRIGIHGVVDDRLDHAGDCCIPHTKTVTPTNVNYVLLLDVSTYPTSTDSVTAVLLITDGEHECQGDPGHGGNQAISEDS